MKSSPEDFGIIKYKMNNGKVDVYQDVKLDNQNLSELPFEFGKVNGDFNISKNHISSLKKFPHHIDGSLEASDNKLTELSDLPKEIHNCIDLNNNLIESFDGLKIPKALVLTLNNNPIKSLKNFPTINQKIKLCLDNCNLRNLKNLNTSPSLNLTVCHNQLIDLSDLRGVSLKELDCQFNQIETLVDGPKEVRNLMANFNKIKSLKGLPDSSLISLNNNLLTDIDFPEYWATKNLTNFYRIYLRNNPLINIDQLEEIQDYVYDYPTIVEMVYKNTKFKYIMDNLK